jgi:hypothetical protein
VHAYKHLFVGRENRPTLIIQFQLFAVASRDGFLDAWVGRRTSGEHASVGLRLKLPSWYRLQPETEEIVKVFLRVSLLRERAADGKDLAVVESALTDLGTFSVHRDHQRPWSGTTRRARTSRHRLAPELRK